MRDKLGQQYAKFKIELSDIADKALAETGIDYTNNIIDATNSIYQQLLTYTLYENPQIRLFRQLLSGEETKPQEKKWVLPSTITIGALAVLSGALHNPTTGEPEVNTLGQYYNDGIASVGTLYTGAKTLKKYSDTFEEQFGFRPEFEYVWRHLRNFGTSFAPHVALDYITVTPQNWMQVLANNTAPWLLTPYFYPGDHKNCLCALQPKFHQNTIALLDKI